jgi:hypothetical protein
MTPAPHRRVPRIPALLAACGLAATLLGCPAHSGRFSEDDPLASVQTPPSGFAIKGRMYLTVRAPRWDVSGTTSTTMVIHRPTDLFLQVRGPVNNVMLQGTSNREELVLVIPPMNKAFTAASPDAAMQALTGGALGVDGVLAMLLARLPSIDLETEEIIEEPKARTFVLSAPGEYQVQATIDSKRHRLRDLTIRDREQQTLVEVSYEGSFRDARAYYPELMSMSVPALDLELKADFQAWEVMGEVPSIFTTPVPEGAEVVQLEQVLEGGVSLPPATDAHLRP